MRGAPGSSSSAPPRSAIRAMGSTERGEAAHGRGPACRSCRATTERTSRPERLRREAEGLGWPVLLKASRRGGGGRGMRAVERAEDFDAGPRGSEARGGGGLRRRFDAHRALRRGSLGTSRSRCSPTATATSCTSSSATAPPSAGTRRSSRRRPRPTWKASSGLRCARRRPRRPAPSATRGRGTVEFLLDRGGEFWFHGDEHPAPGRAPGDRARDRDRPRRMAAPGRERRARPAHPGRDRHPGARHRGAPLRGRSGPRISAFHRAPGPPPPARERAVAEPGSESARRSREREPDRRPGRCRGTGRGLGQHVLRPDDRQSGSVGAEPRFRRGSLGGRPCRHRGGGGHRELRFPARSRDPRTVPRGRPPYPFHRGADGRLLADGRGPAHGRGSGRRGVGGGGR